MIEIVNFHIDMYIWAIYYMTDSLSVKVVALFQMFKATFIESHVEIPSFISWLILYGGLAW